MYETEHNGKQYCFFDDHMTINGVSIPYERMTDIGHRSGDAPAFVFTYHDPKHGDRRFAMSYPPGDLQQILPYLKKASAFTGQILEAGEEVRKESSEETAAPESFPATEPDEDTTTEPVEDTAANEPASTDDKSPQEAPENPPETKRSSRKKGILIGIIIAVVVVIAIIAFIAFGGGGSSTKTTDITKDNLKPVAMADDKTGSTKKVEVKTEDADPNEYAVDYYNKFFSEGDKVHWIIDKGTQTATSITDNGDGTVTVQMHEYIEGEDASSETLEKGEVWEEYTIDLATGENLDEE